jgi:hypothetical protein
MSIQPRRLGDREGFRIGFFEIFMMKLSIYVWQSGFYENPIFQVDTPARDD